VFVGVDVAVLDGVAEAVAVAVLVAVGVDVGGVPASAVPAPPATEIVSRTTPAEAIAAPDSIMRFAFIESLLHPERENHARTSLSGVFRAYVGHSRDENGRTM
jgi:hypothetical protein